MKKIFGNLFNYRLMMKTLITLFLGLLPLAASSQSDLELKAYSNFSKNKDTFEHLLKSAINQYKQSNDTLSWARCLQNTGFLFEEVDTNYSISFYNIQKAIKLYTLVKDTMSLANLEKYLIVLYAKMGDHDFAEMAYHNVIELYNEIDFESGKAVSNFNFALAKQYEGEVEKSNELLLISKAFWKARSMPVRIFLINIELIRNACQLDNSIDKLVRECNIIIEDNKIPQQIIEKYKSVTATCE